MTTTTTGGAPPDQEERLIAQRRQLAGVDSDAPRCGLALSGGGIRSATFCFGLLRGLARQKVLTHFDYLSTVSGGGYIGAALGRLYQSDCQAPQVQERLAKSDTLLLWWLRSNGRYLTPAGARDLGQAAASILRNMLFSHFEVAALMLLCAVVILLPYALMGIPDTPAAWGLAASASGWPAGFWQRAGSVWWYFMALALFAASHFIFRYWLCRDWPSVWSRMANVGGALLAGGLGVMIAIQTAAQWHTGQTQGLTLALNALMAGLLMSPLSAVLRSLKPLPATQLAALRLRHTKRLSVTLWLLLGFAFIGLLDYSAWWLVNWLQKNPDTLALHYSAGGLAAFVAGVRTALPRLQRWLAASPVKAVKTQLLLNLGGLLLVLLLALVWMTTLQALVQPKWPWTAWPLASSMGRWGVVAALALAYFVLTRQDFEVLNLSSLHNFYRARIERAYVSVGNYARARASTPALRARFPAGSPLGEVHRASTERVAKLIEAVDGDDIDLARYQPHTHGGPIHLITCCINQSVDDRTGNYNADRQGIALTVSALGAETGTAQPTPLAELPKPSDTGKLSKWIAISGAAASSGMGSQTSPGLAALLFLSGLRLGYWTPKMLPLPVLPSAAGQNPPSRSDRARQWLAMQFPRPSLLMAEFMARFPGLRSATWYVSDGGHFENTGVYALLKRQLDVIVAADCGADPN